METKILKSSQIDQAVELLKAGEVVALPTETVYGLAADALNDDAIKKIFAAKGRPSDHPLILHIDSFDKVHYWADNVTPQIKKLADHFWPGPLTMIVRKKDQVSKAITGGLDTIALRIPKHHIMLEVISKLGHGVVAPSANAHQKTSPTEAEHVLKTLGGKIAAIVDGGSCGIGIESTIIDMTKKVPVILRPGSITKEMIKAVLQTEVECPSSHNAKVSGNMKIHYQPEKPLFLLSVDQIEHLSRKESNVAIVHHSKIVKTENALYYQMSVLRADYAKNLYKTLHEIDNTAVTKIFVEMPPHSAEWADIYDRLTKASTKE